MAISVDWADKIINVPKDFMELVQSSPTEIRELDLNAFRMALKDLEDDEEGMPFLDTHRHNTEVELGGIIYARVIEIINGYTVTFENGYYAVNLVGANSNVGDVVNVNNVSVRSANSAGLISNAAIEYSSFDDGVTVDVLSEYSGTLFPVGTPRRPVNNIPDAVLIADVRGFKNLFIKGDIELGSGDNTEGMSIFGENILRTTITIGTEAEVTRCVFSDCCISGVLDGDNLLENCEIEDLLYLNGSLENCRLTGTIVLAGEADAAFYNCSSFTTDLAAPIIDMGGSGQNLSLKNYSGAVKITNLAGDNFAKLDLNSGAVEIDSTVSNGNLIIRGIGTLDDNSTGTAVIDATALISKTTISEAVWDEPLVAHVEDATAGFALMQRSYQGKVFIDPVNGENGTVYPFGIRQHAVADIDDALIIAGEYGLTTIHVIGSLIIPSGEILDGLTFTSDRSVGNSVWLKDAVTNGTYFDNLTVSGVFNGRTRLTYCALGEIVGFDGGIKNSLLTGNIVFSGVNLNYMTDCDTFITSANGYRELDLGSCLVNMIRSHGHYKLKNKTGVLPTYVGMTAGEILVDGTCVAGLIHFDGVGEVIDESTGTCEVETASLTSPGEITNQIWDEGINDHLVPGSTGKSLSDSGGSGNPWSLLVSGNMSPDSFGEKVGRKLLTTSKYIALK